MNTTRRFPIGAEPLAGQGVHFRVWAPHSRTVELEWIAPDGAIRGVFPLSSEDEGFYSGLIPEMRAGDRYKYRLASGSFADPASRFQPEGPHGPSEVVDGSGFPWTDREWRGRSEKEWVIYELHLGTFTPEGTWEAAMRELPELEQLGITVLEIMPIADFEGAFGWGYDGVNLYAPAHRYGGPEDVRAFVDRAHQLGLMVILDVVYNHLGPDGNYLRQFADAYFSQKHKCEWGDAINFDGEQSGPVREFFATNARYWIEEFHFDGLRLDATQQIFDDDERHILREVTAAARSAGRGRRILVVAENEPQDGRLVLPPEHGGFGMDAVWNDDFHHSAAVATTSRADGYYVDYRGTAQELVSAAKYGFLYQGQWYRWQKARRGRPALDLPPSRFVVFLQNHDQVANSLHGKRLHELTSPGEYRALTALLLLGPCTPLLFQGQEFAASTPFLYFADHHPELRKLVRTGRHAFLRQFRTIACAECGGYLADPGERSTFEASRLKLEERSQHRAAYQMHRDLLRLRREDAAIAAPRRLEGAVLSERAFVLRFFAQSSENDRLLVVNLGRELTLPSAAEPLLAPPWDRGWTALWSSENPAYGGGGTPELETTSGWILPGRAAVLLKSHEHRELHRAKLAEKD